MSAFNFTKADRKQRPARVFLAGVSGSGKTWTAMTWMTELCGGNPWGVIDTEHGSALDYADEFEFEHLDLRPPYSTERYIGAINAAADAGLGGLVIDSLSHAWAGKGGLLEQVDQYGKSHKGDSFGGWRDATPKHLELIEAMLSFPGHLIACARAKTGYQMQQNERGKWEPVKIGLEPVQRDGMEYEFQVVAELAIPGNVLTISKTRCPELNELVVPKPDATVAKTLAAWLGDGSEIEREARPTVDELYRAAADSTDYDELISLYRRAERFHLLVSPVDNPADPDGPAVSLGQFMQGRGQAAKRRRVDRRAELAKADAEAQQEHQQTAVNEPATDEAQAVPA